MLYPFTHCQNFQIQILYLQCEMTLEAIPSAKPDPYILVQSSLNGLHASSQGIEVSAHLRRLD